jgi:hypothetical protein
VRCRRILRVTGWGLGDIVPRVQLGWQNGDLSYTVWLQAVTPTGRYDVGFSPNIGLNRPGIDTGVVFTWTDEKWTQLQFNGAAGFTFNFENEATEYKTGTEFHFEWAIGYELSTGLMLGVAGLRLPPANGGDFGPGAALGPFKSRVDAIGPGWSNARNLRPPSLRRVQCKGALRGQPDDRVYNGALLATRPSASKER